MTPHQKSRALARMQTRLTLRGLSPSTHATYQRMARQFLDAVGKTPGRVTRGDVERYLLGLLTAGKSVSTRNTALAAIRFLLRSTTRRNVTVGLPRCKRRRELATVLSGTEVERLLEATQSAKYRAIFMLAYGAGLRVSEVRHLCVQDIDSGRGLIHIRYGKTAERYAPLGNRMLAALRAYWKEQRPPGPELFPGRGRRVLSRNAIHQVLSKVVRRAEIEKHVTPHTFRHSFATHLLDTGLDVRSVQVLLGHACIESTARYLHLSRQRIAGLPSPLDLIGTPRGRRL